MKQKSLSRRNFVKRSTTGTTGFILASAGMSTFASTIISADNKPAFKGGRPMVAAGSEFSGKWPVYDESDIQMYVEAFKSNKWSEFDNDDKNYTARFEKMYAGIIGTRYCSVTNSGTNALEAAHRAADIGPGDEVITQTNTFIATAQSSLNVYALPVLVDSDPETFQMDAGKIEERINERTRAIIPVHIGGGAANMDKVLEVAKKHNLLVIEDVCQAHMGEWRGRKLGSLGDMGCFSFQAFKSLCGGEGGAVTGNDEALMTAVAAYVNNGRDPHDRPKFYKGANQRMTPFVASVLLGQVRRLEALSRLRDENAQYLDKLLSEVKGVKPVKKYEGQTRRAYYEYQLIYDATFFNGLPKWKFRKAMEAEGIELGNGIDSSLHRSPEIEAYLSSRSFQRIFSKERLDKYRIENRCPVNEKIERETGLSVPQIAFMGTKKDIEMIVDAIVKIQKHSAELVK